jgi:hypothetical protein
MKLHGWYFYEIKNGTRTRDLIAKCRLCRNSFHRSTNYIVFRYSVTNNSLLNKNRFHVQGNLVKVNRVWESKRDVFAPIFFAVLPRDCLLPVSAVLSHFHGRPVFIGGHQLYDRPPVAFHLANACIWTGHLYNIIMLSSSNRYEII